MTFHFAWQKLWSHGPNNQAKQSIFNLKPLTYADKDLMSSKTDRTILDRASTSSEFSLASTQSSSFAFTSSSDFAGMSAICSTSISCRCSSAASSRVNDSLAKSTGLFWAKKPSNRAFEAYSSWIAAIFCRTGFLTTNSSMIDDFSNSSDHCPSSPPMRLMRGV